MTIAKPARVTYSVREVSEKLGIGKSTIYDAIGRGELLHVKIGSRVMIPRWVIDNMLQGQPIPADATLKRLA